MISQKRKFVKLKYYSKRKLKKEILESVGRYLDLKKYKIFFFGSRVAGKGSERSDIDVGIEGEKPLPAGVLLNIQEEIERLPTLYKIEIVDFAQTDSRFKKIAKEHIEMIK